VKVEDRTEKRKTFMLLSNGKRILTKVKADKVSENKKNRDDDQ
jgi:hypothetical protein